MEKNYEQKSALVKVEAKEDYVSMVFSGSLEYGIIGDVKKEIQAQFIESGSGYIIDMTKVVNIDSTGFGMIVNFARKVSVKGSKIAIIVVDDFVRNLFSISQCDKVFPIVKSEKEAKEAINGNWVGELTIDEY